LNFTTDVSRQISVLLLLQGLCLHHLFYHLTKANPGN
jgi:hypothetical protein